MSYANLHLHSVYSDSQFTLLQLVRLGKALGYKALALTDHETDGGVKDFITAANQEGIDALSGLDNRVIHPKASALGCINVYSVIF